MRGRWVSVRSTPRAFMAFPGVQPLEGYSLEIRVRVLGDDSGRPQGRVVAFTSVTVVLQRRQGR